MSILVQSCSTLSFAAAAVAASALVRLLLQIPLLRKTLRRNRSCLHREENNSQPRVIFAISLLAFFLRDRFLAVSFLLLSVSLLLLLR